MREKTGRTRLRVRLVFIALSLLWMGLIFFFSSQTGPESDELGGGAVSFLQKLFFPDWAGLSEEEFLSHMGNLTYLVRKTAHFTEFMVLGGLFSGIVATLPLKWVLRFLAAASSGILYACSDEFHQSFVSERSMSAFDVCIDGAGVVTGVLAVLGIAAMVYASKRERNAS